MKRLHLLVLKTYIGPLILTFFIVVFLLLMQFLWKYIDDLVGKGLDLPVIAELLIYTSASFVPLALPLAILLASLMTFGNLGENNELLALKSAGISLQKIMYPLIVMTIFLSILAFFFANNVLPVINLHARILLDDIRKQRPELSIKPGIFYNGIENYSIRIDQRDTETGLLQGIRIYDHSEQMGNIKVTLADSGYMKITEDESQLLVTLYSGKTFYEVPEITRNKKEKRYPFQREFFDEQNIIIHLEGFGLNRTDKSLYANSYQMMTIKQLDEAQDSIRNILNTEYRIVAINLNQDLSKNIKSKTIKKRVKKGDTLYLDPYYILDTMNIPLKKKTYETAISTLRSETYNNRHTSSRVESIQSELRRHLIQWHKKVTLAFACFVFFFIGAPLGAIIRKGGLGTPIVVSVIFFLVYYMISLSGEKLAREGLWDPFWGMWVASNIIFVSGVFLTYKATTDSVILNTDTYIKFFKDIFGIKRFFKKNPGK